MFFIKLKSCDSLIFVLASCWLEPAVLLNCQLRIVKRKKTTTDVHQQTSTRTHTLTHIGWWISERYFMFYIHQHLLINKMNLIGMTTKTKIGQCGRSFFSLFLERMYGLFVRFGHWKSFFSEPKCIYTKYLCVLIQKNRTKIEKFHQPMLLRIHKCLKTKIISIYASKFNLM